MANNPAVYNAVISGAAGGMQDRWIASALASDYSAFRDAVNAIALTVDNAIPPIIGGPSNAQLQLMQSICQGVFSSRYALSQTAADFSAIASAIATAWTVLASSLTPAGANPNISPTASVIGWNASAPITITLLPAGHAPGQYSVSLNLIVRATSGGTITRSYQFSAPIFGPTAILGFGSVGINLLGATPVSFTAIGVISDGSAPITVTLTPAGVAAPIIDVYASARMMGS